MQTKKYEFVGETKRGLRRIRRISDGMIGGWIESESNLSHEGDCFVYDDARVYGNARVIDDALVSGEAQVYGNALIYGGAYASDNARVYDDAHVYGDASVNGMAQVYGNAIVEGSSHISGRARVHGFAHIYSNMRVGENARVSDRIKCASRSDGYMFALIPCADKIFRVSAGCRFFTMEQAWKHWGYGFRANTHLGLESEDILVMFELYIQRIGEGK